MTTLDVYLESERGSRLSLHGAWGNGPAQGLLGALVAACRTGEFGSGWNVAEAHLEMTGARFRALAKPVSEELAGLDISDEGLDAFTEGLTDGEQVRVDFVEF